MRLVSVFFFVVVCLGFVLFCFLWLLSSVQQLQTFLPWGTWLIKAVIFHSQVQKWRGLARVVPHGNVASVRSLLILVTACQNPQANGGFFFNTDNSTLIDTSSLSFREAYTKWEPSKLKWKMEMWDFLSHEMPFLNCIFKKTKSRGSKREDWPDVSTSVAEPASSLATLRPCLSLWSPFQLAWGSQQRSLGQSNSSLSRKAVCSLSLLTQDGYWKWGRGAEATQEWVCTLIAQKDRLLLQIRSSF